MQNPQRNPGRGTDQDIYIELNPKAADPYRTREINAGDCMGPANGSERGTRPSVGLIKEASWRILGLHGGLQDALV